MRASARNALERNVGSPDARPPRAVAASFLKPAAMMSNLVVATGQERNRPETRLSAMARANPARQAMMAPSTTEPPASMASERFHWLRSGSL